VYATAATFDGVEPGPGLTNPMTITFPTPVTSFSVSIFNGLTTTASYTVSDNVGDSTSITLPPDSSTDEGTVALTGLKSGATKFTITSSSSPWDFSIDNIAYNVKPSDAQIPKNPSIPDKVGYGISVAAAWESMFAILAAPESDGLSLLLDRSQVLALAGDFFALLSLADPFDAAYKQEYFPTFHTISPIQADSVVTAAFASEANTTLSDGSKSVSYLQAVYVSLNRYNSALQSGDQASANLQNVALETYLSLSSSYLGDFTRDLTTLLSDASTLKINTNVTSAQIASFINSIKSGGFAALPQDEQNLFNTFGFTASDDQSMLGEITSLDPSQVPLSLTAALQDEASAVGTLASIYGTVEGGLTVLDTTTGKTLAASPATYTGPVSGLQGEYINITTDNLNVTSTIPNMFIHTGPGMDGIDVSQAGGNNILDGSTGSNFLIGGSGDDSFYLDDRNPAAPIFSTIVNFHSGDNVTVWGVNATDFTVLKLDNQGAPGFLGVDIIFTAPGHVATSFVLAGYTSADLSNGKLTSSYGTTPNLPGLPGSEYLTVHAT
jgi:hypothetical protein